METIKIYECTIDFRYTQYYIKVILIAINETEAKNKFILKCLEKYDKIITIDFTQFYDKYECVKLPLNFPQDNTIEFKKYLNKNSEINCLNDYSFEIINKYE
jgi:hypothetical protein